MSELVTGILSLGAGAALGALFFGGLWWTVRRGVASRRPALWFVGGTLLRASAALAGFLVVGGGRFDRFVFCLAGFVGARLLVLRLTGRVPHEARHAP